MKTEYYNVNLETMKVRSLGIHDSYESADEVLTEMKDEVFEWIETKAGLRTLFKSIKDNL